MSKAVPGDGQSALTGPIAPAQLDDAVPLPRSAEVVAANDGDRVIAEASGDPFFLGFVAGPYYPPADEAIDPELTATLPSHFDDGRPAQETYAFVMFSKRMTAARTAALEALGCRTLGFHPHYLQKVALPPAAIEQVAALDFVRWIGAPKSWQKVHPNLAAPLASAQDGELVDVWIDVYDTDLGPQSSVEAVGSASVVDRGVVVGTTEPVVGNGERWMSNGWQQHALEALGVEIVEYFDQQRAFRARIAPVSLETLVALDFVQFVEPDLPVRPLHDESMPLAALDYSRATYDGGANIPCAVGIVDSGVDISHSALNHVFAAGWDTTPENDPWDDGCGHGTHVSGTMLGFPDAPNVQLRGAAPGSSTFINRRFRVAKIFDGACDDTGSSSIAYSHMRNVYVDGFGIASPPPFAVNNSWGADPGMSPWVGSEASARLLDDEVYDHDQLYVFSAGNAGAADSTVGLPAVAKNAFTVGSVIDYEDGFDGDPGSLRSSSSRGPCGDDRWKPNVSAPGRWIRSATAGTVSGFHDGSGTSMAAPHVTGLAAQLFDHYSFLDYEPARTSALIMATAMTNEDYALSVPSSDPDHHLNTFGAGRINATRANFVFGGHEGWLNWGFTLNSGTWTFGDFNVVAGCTRIVVVMTYLEESSSAGASQALVNDIDLWIDGPQGGIGAGGNTGEYFAQQSPRDNTEIRYIDAPPVGAWRWKAYSDSTSSASKVGVTVVFVYDDTTPNGSLSVTADDTFVQPNDDVTITATADSPEYFASCVFLDSTSNGDALQSSTTVLADGIVADLMDNQEGGRDLLLGTFLPDESRSATWVTRWATEGVKNWQVEARSDNWNDETDFVQVTVDGTPPGLPTNLHSTSHTINVWSNDNTLAFAWTAATDNLSGVDGYGISWGTAPGVFVADSKDIEQAPLNYTTPSLGDTASRYFAMKTVDNSGNWTGGTAEVGPYKIDTVNPSAATNLASPTHSINVQSCDTNVTVTWTAATDALSGIASYRGAWNTLPVFDPVGGAIIPAGATSNATDIGSSTSARYFHLRPLDTAGNWGPTAHFGPVFANSAAVVIYCTGKVNSIGCTPSIGSNGAQPSLGAGNFAVTCTNAINNRNGFLFWGFASSNAAFQGGIKCVAAPTLRTPIQSSGGSAMGTDCSGSYSFTFTTGYLNSNGVSVGDELFAQQWMRDPQSPSTTGLSNGLRFTLCE